jgi:oligoribonuclease
VKEQSICWIDVETTGTDCEKDVLLEVACLVTDLDLNILDESGYESVLWYPEGLIDELKTKTVPFVIDMHEKTGLWDRLPQGKMKHRVDAELIEYIQNFIPEPQTARLGGNSITLDRNFINKNLPSVGGHLHYRSVDVSTLSGLVQYWDSEQTRYRKKTVHSAMSDIRESIEELQFLRKRIFS